MSKTSFGMTKSIAYLSTRSRAFRSAALALGLLAFVTPMSQPAQAESIATEARVIDEPAYGFALRVPANWDFVRSAEGGIDYWTLRNRAWRGDAVPDALVEVVVSVLERTAGKDPVEEFRDFAHAFADEKLSSGSATEFGPHRMGNMSGFAARASGRIGAKANIPASAVILLFEVGDRHVLTWAIAPAPSAVLLDAVGQPGAIFGPSPGR